MTGKCEWNEPRGDAVAGKLMRTLRKSQVLRGQGCEKQDLRLPSGFTTLNSRAHIV